MHGSCFEIFQSPQNIVSIYFSTEAVAVRERNGKTQASAPWLRFLGSFIRIIGYQVSAQKARQTRSKERKKNNNSTTRAKLRRSH